MAKGQVSIGITGKMEQVLSDAYEAFPSAKSDAQALTLFVLEMHRVYRGTGKTMLEADVAEMKKILHHMMEMMTPGK